MINGLYFNSAQIKGLAGLFFNLATGLILGGIGFVVVGQLEAKIFISALVFIMSLASVRAALNLLKGVNE